MTYYSGPKTWQGEANRAIGASLGYPSEGQWEGGTAPHRGGATRQIFEDLKKFRKKIYNTLYLFTLCHIKVCLLATCKNSRKKFLLGYNKDARYAALLPLMNSL